MRRGWEYRRYRRSAHDTRRWGAKVGVTPVESLHSPTRLLHIQNKRVVTRNGIATSEPSTYYTYTIQNTQPNRAHQRIYTSWPYVKQLITYNSNNSITSTTAPYANCTYTEGLDNPTFDMQIGQQWDSTYSRKCDQGSQGSSVQYQY